MPANHFGSVVVVGPPFGGKTALINQVLYELLLEEYDPTPGVQPHRLQGSVGEKDVACILWDTAGDARFRELRKAYFAAAAVVIIVADVTRHRSILETRSFYNDVIASSHRDATIILVGTKTDLNKDQYQDDLIRLSEEWRCSYHMISVKNKDQVNALFAEVLKEVYSKANQRMSVALKAADSKRKEHFAPKIKLPDNLIIVDQNNNDNKTPEINKKSPAIISSLKSYLKKNGWKLLLGAIVVASLLFGVLAVTGGFGALSVMIAAGMLISKAGADVLLAVLTLILGAGIGAAIGALIAKFHQSDKVMVSTEISKSQPEMTTKSVTQTLEKKPGKVKAAAEAYQEKIKAQTPEVVPVASSAEKQQASPARMGRRL